MRAPTKGAINRTFSVTVVHGTAHRPFPTVSYDRLWDKSEESLWDAHGGEEGECGVGERGKEGEKTKKTSRSLSDLFMKLDGALNLVGTEASCTDVHMAGGAVNDSLNTLYIGLPGTVGASVGVRDLNTKGNTLATNITFCQLLHLQSWGNSCF